MTLDEIAINAFANCSHMPFGCCYHCVLKAIQQAVEEEREECAKLASSHECGGDDDIICQGKNCGTCIAGAIYQRGAK